MFGCGWINERHLALLAQDTTLTPAGYTKTIYLFDHFHQDYNAKVRLEKKIHLKQETKVQNTQKSEAPN